MIDRLTLNIYQPIRADVGTLLPPTVNVIDLNPRITSCVVDTAVPGGFMTLTVGVENRAMPNSGALAQPVEFHRFSHVVLKLGGRSLFEGRWQTWDMPYGVLRSFSAQGYGKFAMEDGGIVRTTTLPLSTGNLLRTVLRQQAPLIQVPDFGPIFQDPGGRQDLINFSGKSPWDIVTQIGTEGGQAGNSLGVPFDWAVWEDRYAQFIARVAPATPNYQADWDVVSTWQADDTDSYGTVSVSNAGAITPAVTSQAFLNDTGIMRYKIVSGGTNLPNANARQVAGTYLELHRRSKISAVITLNGNQRIRKPGGAEVEAWMPRAGEWVRIGGAPNTVGPTSPDEGAGEAPLIIIATHYDCFSGVATLTLESYPFHLRSIYDLVKVTEAVRRGVNPNTGA